MDIEGAFVDMREAAFLTVSPKDRPSAIIASDDFPDFLTYIGGGCGDIGMDEVPYDGWEG